MKKSKKGFWADIKKPFVVMAPMADVTDAPFRAVFAKYGRPDVSWTEFVSADGLFLRPLTPDFDNKPKTELERIGFEFGIGTDHPLLKDLIYGEAERPIVAQFFSKDPSRMKKAAALAEALGYDGIDINMGCPASVICNQGAGCGMIKTPKLAQEVIQAAIEGAGNIPVSVKTRIGYSQNELEMWLPNLLDAKPVLVTMHARTKKNMSKVPARWEFVKQCVEIRNDHSPDILIAGNGDVSSLSHAAELIKESGADGAMVARGMYGNPWFFNREVQKAELPLEKILSVLLEHTKLFEEILGETKNFAIMKKHFKAYISGFTDTKELRIELMGTKNFSEVQSSVQQFLRSRA